MRRLVAALLCVKILAFSSRADAVQPPRDVSAELRTLVVQNNVPALLGGIVDESGLVALGAAGVRRKGSPFLVTKDDKVHLGSCTKAMTATLVALLVEGGAMSWNDTVGDSFPELRQSMNAKWQPVTVTELLTHSGGAPKDLRFDGLWDRLWYSQDPPLQQRLELVRSIVARAPAAPPGTKFIYSNGGYAIAGAIAERKTGESYEDLMRKRLFEPLGMTTAGFGAPGSTDRVDQPRGHTDKGESVEPIHGADNPPAIAPAGTVHCSISDWGKFVKLHLDAAMGNPRMLTAESFERLHTAANGLRPEYGMGWGIVSRDWAGGEVLTHNGTNTMWFCVVWLAPRKGIAIMAACNQGGERVEKVVDEVAGMLIKLHAGTTQH